MRALPRSLLGSTTNLGSKRGVLFRLNRSQGPELRRNRGNKDSTNPDRMRSVGVDGADSGAGLDYIDLQGFCMSWYNGVLRACILLVSQLRSLFRTVQSKVFRTMTLFRMTRVIIVTIHGYSARTDLKLWAFQVPRSRSTVVYIASQKPP